MKTQTKNTAASLLAQGVSVLCGLILPRQILLHYGSEMNGLAHSVSQFLQFAVVMELGLGAVIPAAFYKPLAERNYGQISAILTSAYRTFRKMAAILAAYIGVLVLLFPRITNSALPWEASAAMLICVGLGAVVGYLAGKPENLLLISDQKGYVSYTVSIVTTVLSTAASLVLIRMGCQLATIKLAASLISIGSIVVICQYVTHHYPVTRRAQYAGEPIPQKWNGIAQHIAYIVLEYTDIIVLTLFMSFREVSVYSVYLMVITGIKRFFTSATYSIQPKLGELWAKGERDALERFFSKFECGVHLCAVLLFTCTGLLIVPFVRVYTDGVTDTQYIQPLFACLLTLAYGVQCLRDPYDKLILASGHFRQTQHNYIIAASLNIVLSVLAVGRWGLPGVAAGTLVAMVYQTAYMAYYDSRVLLKRPLRKSALQLLIDAVTAGAILLVAGQIHLNVHNMATWFLQALSVFAVAAAITGVVALICFRWIQWND